MTRKPLPHALPTEMGVEPSAILTLLDRLEEHHIGMHGLMILRHGKVLAEGWWKPYRPEYPHQLFSLSKSFTSTAIGFAVQEGLLTLEDKLVSFFPEKLPCRPCEYMEKVTLRNLLTMNSGHSVEPDIFGDPDPATAFLRSYIDCEPGTLFVYNTAATYMLSAVLQKVTGMTTEEYLIPRLFEPLGIESHVWDQCPQGVSLGGFGLNITTESIARFGQFLLQRGVWEGKRLLNEAWFDLATSYQTPSVGATPDWASGYGFQFWMCAVDGAFRGDGAFGQYCLVLPKQDMVIVINEGTDILQTPLTCVWESILPAVHEEPLPADEAAQSALEERLASLSFALGKGEGNSEIAAKISGKVYELSDNEHFQRLRLDWDADHALTLWCGETEARLPIGSGDWALSDCSFEDHLFSAPGHTATAGAWEGNTLHLDLQHVNAPFRKKIDLTFDGQDVIFELEHDYDGVGKPFILRLFGRQQQV